MQTSEGLREPSGLAFEPSTGLLLAVSDDSRHLFRIDLKGAVIGRLPGIEGLEDPEAVAAVAGGTRVLVLSEDDGAILSMTPGAPDNVHRHSLSQMEGFDAFLAVGDDVSLSPEGLDIDAASGAVLVANERDPRALIEVSPALDRIMRVTVLTQERGFVCPAAGDDRLDVSGLAVDPRRGGIWITSDTGKCIFFWDRSDRPAQRFELLWRDGDHVRAVDNAEGVALDQEGGSLFVVTDDSTDSRLFRYYIE